MDRLDITVECRGADISPFNSHEFHAELTGVDFNSLISSILSSGDVDEILNKMKVADILSWVEGNGYTVQED